MPDVVSFWSQILSAVAEFLMQEPIVYFTAIFLLLYIVALVRRIIE